MILERLSFPVELEPDEAGRLVVHFLDLPEALTDGADMAEALAEAADCLSRHWPIGSTAGRGHPAAEPEAPWAISGGAGCDDGAESSTYRCSRSRRK